jgi:hypothetical protein
VPYWDGSRRPAPGSALGITVRVVADRSARFFMSPDEAGAFLGVVAADGAQVVVAGRRNDSPHRHDPAERLPVSSGFAYLGFPDLSTGDPENVAKNPGAHAWVRFSLPQLTDGVLLMAVLDIRTKWLHHDNPSGLGVFKRLAKRLKPMLSRPTFVWHVSGGESAPSRDIGFTEGAAHLHDHGVEWMQEGALNSRFGPRSPIPDGDPSD